MFQNKQTKQNNNKKLLSGTKRHLLSSIEKGGLLVVYNNHIQLVIICILKGYFDREMWKQHAFFFLFGGVLWIFHTFHFL